MIIKQMTHFSHLLFELYLLAYFIFAFQDRQKSISWDPFYCIMFVSVKYRFTCQR